MVKEPDRRLLKQNANMPMDPNQPKTLTCFPSKLGPGIYTETTTTTNQPTCAPKNIDTTSQMPTQTNSKNVEQVKSTENKQSLDGKI
jgi:hypothetical protein